MSAVSDYAASVPHRLLLVEDDDQIAAPLIRTLEREDYTVERLDEGLPAVDRVKAGDVDLVLLDLGLPDVDGLELCRQLREASYGGGILILTARGGELDRVVGLDLGADDYIAKPFGLAELLARVRALLRRAAGIAPAGGLLHIGDVEIDLERRMMSRGGQLVQLSRTEWLLLQHLAANAGKVVLHTELLTKVWGPEYRDDLQYLRVWISRVRRKLGALPGEPGPITTFQGIGYVLNVDETPPLEMPMDGAEVGGARPVSGHAP